LKGSLITRIVVILLVVLFSGYFLIPTVKWYSLPQQKKDLYEKEYLQNPVETNASVSNVAVYEAKMREIDKLRELKSKTLKLGLDLQGGMHVVLQAEITNLRTDKERNDALVRALEILRNRVDKFGVSEPSITRQGNNNIVVELPDVKDPKRAMALIGGEGELKFKIVDDVLSKEKNFEDYKKGILKKDVVLPEDETVAWMYFKNKDTQKLEQRYPVVVKKNAALTGSSLKTAEVGFSQFGEAQVDFELKPEGANIFAEVTGANVGKQLAIELDGKIRSAPVIRDKLFSRGQISGGFSLEEAKDLALILRAGALPVKLEIVEQRVVGPSLGADSIKAGIKSAWIAIIMIFTFMLIYYKVAGFYADFSVIINLIVTMGILTGLHFTLTLPGIAGLILTIGMSVDSNVIINERIKEELRAEKTPVAAIGAGYDRAFITVLDAHLTTMIIAIVLYQFGTGPIKGFAATLFIGICANLFTGFYLTRTIYSITTQNPNLRRMSI
jgi:preprotein translocase subunit SecD